MPSQKLPHLLLEPNAPMMLFLPLDVAHHAVFCDSLTENTA
ncbi:MAG TPA: hypothetical protein VMW56_25845 [Candidatus Margulisiibacteriota bacterium]|nr:hypothetical protein [Candidatus Margulisiibacteriota bacterium]